MSYDLPDNNDDVIDSRQIIDRIDELTALLEDLDADEDHDPDEHQEATDELAVLVALAEQGASACTDWSYGTTLIRDSYFREYAEQLAEDCAGSHEEAELIRNGGGDRWPFTFMQIDWDAAAEALKADYTTIDFDGVEYWVWAY
jgi:hypothetical protein